MLKARQRIRIEWAHCDPAKIIFNPHYYIWMDQGTHRLLEAAGFAFAEAVRTTPFRGCVLVSSGATFVKPAVFADIIELETSVTRFGNKSFTVGHRFSRDGDTLATGEEVRVWGWTHPDDADRITSVPVPDDVRDMLSEDRVCDVTV